MIYYEAKILVDLAIEHDLFYTQDNKIAVYHMAEADAERYPEGWYLEEKEDVYQSIATDEEGQKTLIEALQEKGVDFTPYHEKICEYEKTLDLLLGRKKEQRTGNM